MADTRKSFAVVVLLLFSTYSSCFDVYWNVPSQECSSRYGIFLNLSAFGIIINTDEEFRGENIVLFYETKPGLFPKILPNGSEINGGIPQVCAFEVHNFFAS